MSVAVLPELDPNVFVSGSCDSTAKVWDVRIKDACVQTFGGHESDINSVAMLPDGKAFGTGSDDSTCRFFDTRCYGELSVFGNEKIICGVTSGKLAFPRRDRRIDRRIDSEWI